MSPDVHADPPHARPPAPLLSRIIAILVLLATSFSLFSLVQVLMAVPLQMTDAQRQFLESQTVVDDALAIATILGNAAGAILLLMMRRAALYVFVAALIVSVLHTIYNAVVNNWFAAVGVSGLMIGLVGWVIDIAIIIYVGSLFRRGALR